MNTQYRHFPVIPIFMGKRSLMSDTSQYFPYKMGKRLLVSRRNMYYITTVLHTKDRHFPVLPKFMGKRSLMSIWMLVLMLL